MQKNKRLLFYLIIFLSGFTALSYQIIWIKEFELFFGIHIYSISAVLTAFMTGLALGSILFGKLADKYHRIFLLFSFIELSLGVIAIFFKPMLNTWVEVYRNVVSEINYSSLNINLLRFVFSFSFLIIPATLIGGTLPIFMKIAIEKIETLGKKTAWLYGINNLGAFAGCAATGYFLIKTAGLQNSLYILAGLNFLNAMIIYIISEQGRKIKISRELNNPQVNDNPIKLSKKLLVIILVVFAVEGFTTLSYEVIWTRILTEFSYDKTGYLFTTILLSFIFGLSAGSILISKYLDKRLNNVKFLVVIQVLIGIISVLQLIIAASVMPHIIESRTLNENWFSTSGKEYIYIFIFLSVPVLLMGMTFPVVSRIYNQNLELLGKRFGVMGFLDTVGSIFGSFIAGFVLLTFLGTRYALLFTAAINIFMGIWLLNNINLIPKRGRIYTSAGIIIIFLFSSFFFPNDPFFKTQIGKRKGEEILYYNEGISGTVSVHSYGFNRRALAINGALYAFTNYDDALSHRMLGYMPWFYHKNPEEVLVIGFGMGITGSSFRHEPAKKIDIAEINPSVIEASTSFFGVQNRNIIKDERVRIIPDDGRGWLVTGKQKYDIITCDATHPRFGDNLYTVDFYRICRDQLKAEGIMCNWMPFNWVNENEYKALIKAFLEVFPSVHMWYVNRGVCLLLGSSGQLNLNENKYFERFKLAEVQKDFAEIDIYNPLQLLVRFVCDKKQLVEWCSYAIPNSDNFPVVEYGRVVSMSPDYEVLEWIKNTVESTPVTMNYAKELETGQERFNNMLNNYRADLVNDIKNELIRLPVDSLN